jgi:hypothetical protein
MTVRLVYYEAIKMAFLASAGFAALAAGAAFIANGKGLRRECSERDDDSSATV